MSETSKLNRREVFSLVAVTAAGGALMSQTAFAQSANAGSASALLMPAADVCVLTPEVTEGP